MRGDTPHSILGRIVSRSKSNLTQTAARTILEMSFAEADQRRIQKLAEKHTEDKLAPAEKREYEGYVLVGELVALLQAKARRMLA